MYTNSYVYNMCDSVGFCYRCRRRIVVYTFSRLMYQILLIVAAGATVWFRIHYLPPVSSSYSSSYSRCDVSSSFVLCRRRFCCRILYADASSREGRVRASKYFRSALARCHTSRHHIRRTLFLPCIKSAQPLCMH